MKERIKGLVDFEITNKTCFICGRAANTIEHIFPRWLQHKFNLWDQLLILPNETKMPYRQLTVPACQKCNGEVFGKLEKRIQTGLASEKDIWRWANKIHFGLALKDSLLDWDRKHRDYKIGDVISPNDPLEQSRHYLHCVSGDFICEPDPFGSVFTFQLQRAEEYDFIHIIHSSSIFICLGQTAYVVFVRDGQTLIEENVIQKDYRRIIRKPCEMKDVLFFYAKCIEYNHRYHFTLPVMFSARKIIKLGRSTFRGEKPLDKNLFRQICLKFGITWIDEDEI